MRLQSYLKEIEDHLRYLGLWDNLISGKLKCFICKVKLTKDNFGIAFREVDRLETTCKRLDCIRTVTTVLKD